MSASAKTQKKESPRTEELEFFARSASGLEKQLTAELKDLRVRRVRPLTGGVAFFGGIEDALRVCLWSRVASRVLFVVARIDAADADQLYQGVQSIDWSEHIGPHATIAVHAHGSNENLRNTQFIAVRVKDAVCDQLRSQRGVRPTVQQQRPDVLIDIVVRAGKATVSLDFSGESLHRRGYREDRKQSEAPLKENLAAGIVLASGWSEVLGRGGAFVDPLCGSGTLVIEAALIATNRAPGLLRMHWGFTGWQGFDPLIWQGLMDDAQQRIVQSAQQLPALYGFDNDRFCIALAKKNAERAGVADFVEFRMQEIKDLGQQLDTSEAPGLLVTNPPYGQRLMSTPELPEFYSFFAEGIESLEEGWELAVITPDESIDGALGLVPFSTLPFYNGKIETKLRRSRIEPSKRVYLDLISLQGKEQRIALTEKNSEQFAARLRKAAKERMKWARKNALACYRIYDADLPDYVVAIDCYEGAGVSEGERCILVSEYKAPAEIDAAKASRRFSDVLKIVPALLDVDEENVIAKTRRRAKGGAQYQEAKGTSHILQTKESGYLLEVDVGGYLDTGIFLDHRLTRQMLGQLSKGKKVLNLFGYTGVATVHAAGGGAVSTKTVDLSQTYLSWAKRNMALNGFTGKEHSFERADITRWLADEQARGKRYDLIFVDPPTFSNSKAMKEASWSVQRDHVSLLAGAKGLLAEGGKIVFSCNLRSFKPNHEALAELGIALTDITPQTIPYDFERNPKVHQCYLIEDEASPASQQ